MPHDTAHKYMHAAYVNKIYIIYIYTYIKYYKYIHIHMDIECLHQYTPMSYVPNNHNQS